MKRGNHLVQIEGLQANLPVSRKMSNKAPTEGGHAYTHTCTGPIRTYTRFGPPSQRGEGCVGGRASRNKQNAIYLSHPAPDRVAKQAMGLWNGRMRSIRAHQAPPPCHPVVCFALCNAMHLPRLGREGGRRQAPSIHMQPKLQTALLEAPSPRPPVLRPSSSNAKYTLHQWQDRAHGECDPFCQNTYLYFEGVIVSTRLGSLFHHRLAHALFSSAQRATLQKRQRRQRLLRSRWGSRARAIVTPPRRAWLGSRGKDVGKGTGKDRICGRSTRFSLGALCSARARVRVRSMVSYSIFCASSGAFGIRMAS